MWGREAAFHFFCLVEGEGAVIVMGAQTLKAVRKDDIPPVSTRNLSSSPSQTKKTNYLMAFNLLMHVRPNLVVVILSITQRITDDLNREPPI